MSLITDINNACDCNCWTFTVIDRIDNTHFSCVAISRSMYNENLKDILIDNDSSWQKYFIDIESSLFCKPEDNIIIFKFKFSDSYLVRDHLKIVYSDDISFIENSCNGKLRNISRAMVHDMSTVEIASLLIYLRRNGVIRDN